MNRKELFLNLCNAKQAFDADFGIQESKSKYTISGVCPYCKKDDIDDVSVSYWAGVWKGVHKECKKPYNKAQAYEQQCIDANCNDCKFFIAGKTVKGIGTSWREGKCKKGNANLGLFPDKYPAHAQPNFYQGNECFTHRSD